MNLKDLADFHKIELETRKVHGTFCSKFFVLKLMNPSIFLLYLWSFLVIEQIRSGKILFHALQKKLEEKIKMRKLKKEQELHPHNKNIASKVLYILTLYFLANFS